MKTKSKFWREQFNINFLPKDAIDKHINDKSKLVLISELIQIILEKNSCNLVDNLDLLLEVLFDQK
jgi:hypothetical protein